MAIEEVQRVKQQLLDAGVNISGPDGAFEITKRVAATLRLGVLSKSQGNNSGGYAVDIVMARDGRIWDILIDSGGANEPSWNEQPAVDPSRYRDSPWQQSDTPSPIVVPPVVTATSDPRIDALLQRVIDMQLQLNNVLRALPTLVPAQAAPPAYEGKVFGIKIVLKPV